MKLLGLREELSDADHAGTLPDLGLPASRIVINSCCLSHPFGGILLWQLEPTGFECHFNNLTRFQKKIGS